MTSKVLIEDGFVHFEAPHAVGLAMNAVYSKAKGTYRVPYTLGALRELLRQGYDVKEAGINLSQERKELLNTKTVVASAHEKLREYQAQDVNFLLQRDCLANFSEMRTGKTPVMCQVIEKRNVKTIIICPTSICLQWVDEIHRWTGLKAETTGRMTPAKRKGLYVRFLKDEFNVLVMSVGIARADRDKLLTTGAKMLVIDEAHFLRNYKTAQSNGIYALSKQMDYRYAITGTPATNKPDDVYGILKFLQPEKYPSYWQFVERYFTISETPFGMKVGKFISPDRKKEFYEIVEEISVQRKRKEIMQWLPEKQYQTVRLEMDKKQRKAYDQMLETFEVEDTKISASSVLGQLTRLRQITVAPSMLDLDIPSAKEEYLMEWLKDNPTEQVIIFSNFSSYLKKLHQKIGNLDNALITGETHQEDRAGIVKAFQAGKINVILANIQAAGTGLTLDAAGTVIFLDRAYTPTDNQQAEDRIVATTQQSNQNTLIIDLVCIKSVDEKILKMVKNKENITNIVNDYKSIKDFAIR